MEDWKVKITSWDQEKPLAEIKVKAATQIIAAVEAVQEVFGHGAYMGPPSTPEDCLQIYKPTATKDTVSFIPALIARVRIEVTK